MEKQLWYYVCTQRPACPGAIPRGVVHIEDMTQERAEEIGRDGYDIVGYDRQLTEEEVFEYELLPLRGGTDHDTEPTVR